MREGIFGRIIMDDYIDPFIAEHEEAQKYLEENSDEFRDNLDEILVSFRQERLDQIAELFIKRTQNRSSHSYGSGGYKKWEHEMMKLCGYEFVGGEWKNK